MNLKPFKSLLRFLTLFSGVFALSFASLAEIPDGTWIYPCHDGLLKTQIISGGHFSVTIESFNQDKYCQKPSFEFITRGYVEYPSNSLQNIDFSYSEIQLIVYVEEVVADFNERQVCGSVNWKKSEPQTITGLKCALFNIHKETKIPDVGELKYGIYKIENDELFFGKLTAQNDSSTDKKRPIEYDIRGFKKQKPE